MAERAFKIHALGEVAIRCHDRAAMERFYGEVIGLEIMSRRDMGITFFHIAEGVAGHTSVLALFEDAEAPVTGERSSLHHLALSLPWAEQESAIGWYEEIGQPYRIQDFPWIGWRGVFTEDPEGNTVELVAAVPGGPEA
ncbi:MAG: VOC family protein [Pseudomonadota bacterium]